MALPAEALERISRSGHQRDPNESHAIRSGREVIETSGFTDELAEAADLEWEGIENPRQIAFLNAYALVGMVRAAARMVGVCHTTVYARWLKHDSFRECFEAAKSRPLLGLLEDEAIRRAVYGTIEPVFHAGRVVGSTVHYSDTLLALLLKAAAPDVYATARVKIEARGDVRTEPPEIPTDIETQQRVAYILSGASPDEFRALAEYGGDSEYAQFLRWKHGEGAAEGGATRDSDGR